LTTKGCTKASATSVGVDDLGTSTPLASNQRHTVMFQATDEAGRVQSREPRYNMRKHFSAIVGYTVTVE
jgi:hypothetical protein